MQSDYQLSKKMTPIFLIASMLATAGCTVLKDPEFWGAVSQSNSSRQTSTGYYQPQRAIVPNNPSQGTRPSDILALLEGCIIVAKDGQFLGLITQNEVAQESIFNTVGRYGSDVSPFSIFNSVGNYGSNVSPLSPFNDLTSTPPLIINSSRQFVAYLTKNNVKTPAVDPDLFVALRKGSR